MENIYELRMRKTISSKRISMRWQISQTYRSNPQIRSTVPQLRTPLLTTSHRKDYDSYLLMMQGEKDVMLNFRNL